MIFFFLVLVNIILIVVFVQKFYRHSRLNEKPTTPMNETTTPRVIDSDDDSESTPMNETTTPRPSTGSFFISV